MNKKLLNIIKKNSIILFAAAILATSIFYIIKNPNLFTASILSLQEQNFITEAWRDVAYKTNEGYVDIFLAEQKETPKQINFTINFNKESIIIEPENLSGQGSWTYTKTDNEIIIQSTPNTNIDKTQSLLMLPFTGATYDILLSEATSNKKDLSIGSLNKLSWHSE